MKKLEHTLTSAMTSKWIVSLSMLSLTIAGVSLLSVPVFADTTYTKMNATLADTGQSLFSDRPLHAEYVDNASYLFRQEIDSMTLRLSHVGSPTGNATVGVFNSTLGLVEKFGTINVSSGLTGSYTDYVFTLTPGHAHVLSQGEYIGIKYNGGDASNYVRVMRDSATGFDGTNSYHKYYNNTENIWHSETTKDLYLKLTNTVADANDNCDQLPEFIPESYPESPITHWTWQSNYTYADVNPWNNCLLPQYSGNTTISSTHINGTTYRFDLTESEANHSDEPAPKGMAEYVIVIYNNGTKLYQSYDSSDSYSDYQGKASVTLTLEPNYSYRILGGDHNGGLSFNEINIP